MPSYTFKCQCGRTFEQEVSRSECCTPQPCTCGQQAKRVPDRVGFIQKGDGWFGKNQKLKDQMSAKNARLTAKAHRHVPAPLSRLVPNVGGEEVGSWKEARQVAARKGKDTASYEAAIKKEQTT